MERYPVSSFTPTLEKTIPMFRTRAFRALGLTDKEAEAYWKLLEEWPAAKGERFLSFGHEDALQGDMPRRIVYGDAGADLDKPDPKLEAAAAEFLLLFQMDSYEHGDVMWGDDGKLFFWITRADLEACRFEKVRLQLQCH